MKKRSVILLLALGLSGCLANRYIALTEDTRKPTAADKKIIIDYVKSAYFDPYSIRDAKISPIMKIKDKTLEFYCLELNSKNRLGGYVGLRRKLYLLSSEDTALFEDENGTVCESTSLTYVPFPELEKL